jgi:CheY-like chemotaxis protein
MTRPGSRHDDRHLEAAPRPLGCGRPAEAAPTPGAVPMPERTLLNGSSRLEPLHVLVVDDAPEVLDTVVQILEASGARVTAAGTAEEGLAVVARERPDVLLSDLDMPRHDGLWLIREVRKLPAAQGGATPAACLTAHTGEEDRARVLAAGFQCHVPKPMDMDHLLGVVTALAREA